MIDEKSKPKISNVMKIEAGEVQIVIDPQKFNLTPEQQASLQNLINSGSLKGLNDKQRNDLANLKATVTSSVGQTAFLVRFDCKWFRINDESDLSLFGEEFG